MTVTYHEPGFLVSLDAEQRVRYYEWWQRYLRWKRVAQIAFVIAFATGLAYSIVLPLYFPSEVLLYRMLAAVRRPVFLIAFGIVMSGSLMDCPRCGESFRGWFGRRYLLDECQNCGLRSSELSAIARPRRQG